MQSPPGWLCCINTALTAAHAWFCLVQMEAQLLHRKRAGALDRLTQEQRRLHTAGMMLFAFCSASGGGSSSSAAGASGAAAGGASGACLVR